jgi:signal peptidase I
VESIVLRASAMAARTVVRAVLVLSVMVLAAIGVGPHTGRYRSLTVLSGSMQPTMPIGSMVVAVPERTSDLRPGQIITFQAPVGTHWTETHRVVEVVHEGADTLIRTQGDANSVPDPWLARLGNGPVWRTRLVVPWLGSVIRGLRSPTVHRLTVLVAPTLWALFGLVAIWRPGQRRLNPFGMDELTAARWAVANARQELRRYDRLAGHLDSVDANRLRAARQGGRRTAMRVARELGVPSYGTFVRVEDGKLDAAAEARADAAAARVREAELRLFELTGHYRNRESRDQAA